MRRARAWRYGWAYCVVGTLTLLVSGCGKASHGEAREGHGGTESAAGGAKSAAGGAKSAAGGHATAGADGGRGGEHQGAPFPDATEEDIRRLEPLFTGDAEIAAADPAQLIDLATRVGLARGYAMCRCSSPRSAEDLVPCALAESAAYFYFNRRPAPGHEPQPNQDFARCLLEKIAIQPELAEELRCSVRWYQADGLSWLELCSLPAYDDDVPEIPERPAQCPSDGPREELGATMNECAFVTYCDDGMLVPGVRCDYRRDCADGSDEQGCFELIGHDILRCGEEPSDIWSYCDLPACFEQPDGLRCDPEQRDSRFCPDGTKIDPELVCDRSEQCADGADERYCMP